MKHDNYFQPFCRFPIFMFEFFFFFNKREKVRIYWKKVLNTMVVPCWKAFFFFFFPFLETCFFTSKNKRVWQVNLGGSLYWCGSPCHKTKHKALLQRSKRTNWNYAYHKYLKSGLNTKAKDFNCFDNKLTHDSQMVMWLEAHTIQCRCIGFLGHLSFLWIS